MAWYVDRGVRRWHGEFPEPTQAELGPYLWEELDDERPDVDRCGSWSGYKAHRQRGEKACPDCREVINAACRRSRAKRRAREKQLAA